ncbi:MAG: LPS-assembly protein LptD [Betaproteobacteria bacterium]
MADRAPAPPALTLSRTGAALLIALLGVAPASASGEAAQLRLARELGAQSRQAGDDGAAYARAQRIETEDEERIVLSGRAELRRAGTVLRADRIVYSRVADEVQAQGNVRAFRDGLLLTGPELTMQVQAQTGTMPTAQFAFAPRQATGSARDVELLPDGSARLREANFTTCKPDDRAWWVTANELTLDRVDEVAVATGAVLFFKGVPILPTPWLQLPLTDERRSGFLAPTFGTDSLLGFEATLPYYWNIAPNRDATFTPRLMSRRGVLWQNEFRYLEPVHKGQLNYDFIVNDRVTSDYRDRLSWVQQYAGPLGLSAGINYQRVSDDNYLSDFGANVVTSNQRVLPQEGFVAFTRTYWSASVNVTENQTLQDPPAVYKPYERVPQVVLKAQNNDWHGFDLALPVEATRFTHPTLQSGSRLIVAPTVSYPWLAPAGFVVPRVQWNTTYYNLDEPTLAADRERQSSRPLTYTRSLPIASVDAGLYFDRDTTWFGRQTVQTLEPRLFYAYIPPNTEQNSLPDFDSAAADVNLTQLFSENVFVGGDRIGQANQLTAAVSSRFLNLDTGGEFLRSVLGYRYFFSPQQVTLPGIAATPAGESQVLAAVAGRLAEGWMAELGMQYSTQQDRIGRAVAALRWQPKRASVLNLAYRFQLQPGTTVTGRTVVDINQVEGSFQWPLSAQWYAAGRLIYSLKEDAVAGNLTVDDSGVVDALLGLEYRSDCWAMRFGAQRFVNTQATGTVLPDTGSTTKFFFQIEFGAFGRLGTGPVEALQRNIPGFQRILPPSLDAGRFGDYE